MLALADKRVRMVKLLPNYHMYKLDTGRFREFIRITSENNLVISIQIRVEDKRGQYPLMKVEDVNTEGLVQILGQFPGQTFILSNIFLHELPPVMNALGNIYVDISSMETQYILQKLHERYTLDRVLFSSHCPFYYPEGNVNKLKYDLKYSHKYADIDVVDIEKAGYKNALELFNLE